MEEIISKSRCTGCTACISICPRNAISMKENSEGFKMPVIDQEKCIDCDLCRRTCPVINTESNETLNKCYVAYSRSKSDLENSSSGGIFSVIANEILKENGIVIGAMLEKNKLKHIAITERKDLEKLKGSKYLQSDLGNIFK